MRAVRWLSVVLVGASSVVAAADWPQWRGPSRNGLSAEKGLLKEWPDGGPKLLWTAKGLGEGFATMAIADGLIYTAGNVGSDLMLVALDLAGQTKWQVRVGPAYTKDSPGSRSTPTVDGGCVYYETPDGTLNCLDAKSGKEAWSLNILKEFKGRNTTWALSESVLVDGNNLICCPGGPEAAVVALDKKTGKTVWVCKERIEEPDDKPDKPGYASPIVFDCNGLRQIVAFMSHAAIGVNAKTGEMLWRFKHTTSYDANIPTPVYSDGCVFINSGYGSGGELLKLKVEGDKCSVEKVWGTKALDNHHGGVILVDGYLYGSTHGGKWVCLEFKTGQVKSSAGGVGKGSIVYADGMLYCYSERGDVGLATPAPDDGQVVSRFRVPTGGKGPNWPHPVVCGGRLYLRHGDLLFAYDIKGD